MPKKNISVRSHVRRLPSGMRTQVIKHRRQIDGRTLTMTAKSPTFNKLLKLKQTFSKDAKIRKIQIRINDLLYNIKTHKGMRLTNKDKFVITILGSKANFFNFMKDHSRWKVVGTWVGDDKAFNNENNVRIEVEHLDNDKETVGKELVKLFNEYNDRIIKEEVLYTRDEPVEDSSLELAKWRGL